MMMKQIDMGLPIALVGLIFFGLITFTCLANTPLMTELAAFDHQIGTAINGARFALMDKLSPHIANLYFWIPFYCSLILLLAGFDRVKFLRNCLFLSAYLAIAGLCVFMLNMAGARFFPEDCGGFHYFYSTLATMDCSLICLNATLTFGATVFVSLFLDKRFNIIKVSLLLFSLLIIYNLIYQGDDLPVTLLFGMAAGLVSAVACRACFLMISAE